MFVGETKDNDHAQLATVDLTTGHITALPETVVNPKGLLFIPRRRDGSDRGDNEGHDA